MKTVFAAEWDITCDAYARKLDHVNIKNTSWIAGLDIEVLNVFRDCWPGTLSIEKRINDYIL